MVNKLQTETLDITWDNYYASCYRIYTYFLDKDIQAIYGIPRGGLIPAVILSHLFDKPLLLKIKKTYDPSKILIVDDIVDTGKTIKKYVKKGFLTTAIIININRCKVKPDFYPNETNIWVKFPYEVNIIDNVSKVQFREN